VSFDTIAREWRCKWSADADKASLVKAQDELASVLAEVRHAISVRVARDQFDLASARNVPFVVLRLMICMFVCAYACMIYPRAGKSWRYTNSSTVPLRWIFCRHEPS
jgi:hypothetical protein